jgi:hypothetical protein
VSDEKLYALQQRHDLLIAQGWTLPWEAVKSADESRTSTTLTNDGDLQFTNVPIGSYWVSFDCLYTGGAGVSEGDFKIDFNLPGGVGSLNTNGIARLASDAGALHQVFVTGASGFTAWTNGLANTFGFSLTGLLVAAATGTFVLRWACGTNTGTSSRLLQNSRLSIARRI